jgi:hypothetical protein
MKLTLKIRKIAKRWTWQLLDHMGNPRCTAVELHRKPQHALSDFVQVCSYLIGGPIMPPDVPAVGGVVNLTDNVKVWRHS